MHREEKIRLGLCLSGGGFRAALFHLGALAALAERELLHRVEVLSTVSGGSIIGACYYLKVKELLEGRRPGAPLPEPAIYRQIVAELQRDFLAAVQKNVRLRLFSNPWKNWRMVQADYSRTDRLAELLDAFFFAPIVGHTGLRLKDIHIHPAPQVLALADYAPGQVSGSCADEHFDIDRYNARAQYKIPILAINATCLNTGHPWLFTGAYVGTLAPRRALECEVDTNYRLPPLRFDGVYHDDRRKSPECQRRLNDRQQRKLDSLTLADAVAASAAVPGIFPPLALHDLYTNSRGEDIVVQLTDGGVFDNQGVDTLLRHGCTHLILSDGSRPLEDECILGTHLHQVVQRASDIMMDKIRTETLYRVHAGCEANVAWPGGAIPQVLTENAVKGYALIHLRQSFANLSYRPNFPGPVDRPEGLVYRLSNLRTDLDSFSDAEAYALMYDAYHLMHDRLAVGALHGLGPVRREVYPGWRFRVIGEILPDAHRRAWLHERLKTGRHLFFRAFRLRPWRAWLYAAPVLAGLIYGLWAGVCWQFSSSSNHALGWPPLQAVGLCTPAQIVLFEGRLTLQTLWPILALIALAALPSSAALAQALQRLGLVRWLRPRGLDLVLGVVTAVLLSLVALGHGLYRLVFDRIFLRDGRLAQDGDG